jgi:polyhydroxybutyrate depolymerase
MLLLLLACSPPRAPALGEPDVLGAGAEHTFSVPGWRDRDYIVHLPPSYSADTPIPLVFGLHGGGGTKEGFNRSTCPDGDLSAPTCLLQLADTEGFAVVMPDGTDSPGIAKRFWNAGGGSDGWRCVGGSACEDDLDHVAYFQALLSELIRAVNVDTDRVYATGISNGGAMSVRLACELPDVFAAVAPVAGGSQVGGYPGCSPSEPVPFLYQHGTDDPCWGWDGGSETALCEGEGIFRPPEETLAEWLALNGCEGSTEEPLPDTQEDGTRSILVTGTGCDADTVMVRIEGGGHAWADGDPYLGESLIGTVPKDYSSTELVWAFFEAHPRSP